jgi:hypothetical protein
LSLTVSWSITWSATELPSRLSDEEFWELITDFSEPDGAFLFDNFVSNESPFQHVLSDLTTGRSPGGAYLGVGPDQNFTYIVALKPQIAFVFDIRRQNMIEHLMFKALFELSTNRAEFLSRLFSRPPPQNVGENPSVVALFDAFRGIPSDPRLYAENLGAIKDRLMKDHGFELTSADQTMLEYVFTAFYTRGPHLMYNGQSSLNPRLIMPSYEELMMETDEQGEHRSYMATEENFLTIQQYEKNNLLVPLVGDFAGPTAIRAVGEYLKQHNATVSAFYTSNVEQYLFLNADSWRRFYTNVSTLPLDSKSVFIRAVIRTNSGEYTHVPIVRIGFSYLEMDLHSIAELVSAFNAEKILSYYDIIQ